MRFQFLTDEQLRRVHTASIEILETVGVRISHTEALERLKQASAEVDKSAELVKIPEHLVMDSLEKAGKTFTHRRTVQYTGIRSGTGSRGCCNW